METAQECVQELEEKSQSPTGLIFSQENQVAGSRGRLVTPYTTAGKEVVTNSSENMSYICLSFSSLERLIVP